MPGIATHFRILEQVREQLASSRDPDIEEIVSDMRNPNYEPYFYLGAIGPTLADFIPASTSNPYWSIWQQIFGYAGDSLAIDRGILSMLGQAIEYLDIFEGIADDEDVGDLLDMVGEVDNITQLGTDMRNLETDLASLYSNIQGLISDTMRPGLNNVARGSVVPSPDQWRVREYLCWKKPGQFAQALVERAKQAVDDGDPGAVEFRAYAYGYLISYAANVCGSPFINSIVGGPYRTEWWRHRWVSNYIDAWVHGYYGYDEPDRPTVERDVPTPGEDRWTPGYDEWPNLCGADLQNNISMADIDPQEMMTRIWNHDAFPSVLHSEVGRLWDEVFRDVYAGEPIPSAVGPDALNDAYLMTWMVLWFQTSSATDAVLGCQPANTDPPAGCDEPIDPASLAGAGPPDMPTMGSERLIGWGLFLSILGFLFGWWGAFAGGIHGIIEGMPDDEEWAEFRCYVYWWRMYLVNAVDVLHDMLLHYAFVYPYARELNQGSDMCDLEIRGTHYPIPYDLGWRLVKSRDIRQSFPARLPEPVEVEPICRPFYRNPHNTDMFDAVWWLIHPLEREVPGLCALYEIEDPQTTAHMREEYPVFFVTGNPLRDGENDVKTGGDFPFREQAAGGEPVEFGNAVANAVDLFRYLIPDPSKELPDWNLDADRGMAHFTWRFRDDIYTDSVNILPES